MDRGRYFHPYSRQGTSRTRRSTPILRRGAGSHGLQPPRGYGLDDPAEDNIQAIVEDPAEDNIQAIVEDPSGRPFLDAVCGEYLRGDNYHHRGCCCNHCDENQAGISTAHLPGLGYSGWVIVLLRQELCQELAVVLKQEATLDELATERHLDGLLNLLRIETTPPIEPGPGTTVGIDPAKVEFFGSRPLIRNFPCPEEGCEVTVPNVRVELANMLGALASPRGREAGSRLLRSWRIDCREYPERVDDLVAGLSSLSYVELAYPEILAEDAAIKSPLEIDDGSALETDQSYLADAPVGIGARWARPLLNNIEPVRLCDIEQRWVLKHEELPNCPELFFGHNRFNESQNCPHSDGDHGTAVLGQLMAANKLSGIATTAINVSVASHYDASQFSNGNVAEAIVNTLVHWWDSTDATGLHGDVLLLEVQRSGLPTEIDHADREAIRLATAFGLSVIEAAGNAGFDLDYYLDEAGRPILRRGAHGFDDSGAVMVGAAWSALPHDRAWFSNYGSRIDNWGWGDSVTTAGYGDYDLGNGQPTSWYTNSFSGTSAATSCVAGAAALLQAISRTGRTKAKAGHAINPFRLREILSDPATGTSQGPNVAGHIGVMPDLCAIIEQGGFGLPEVYIRRTLADDGWTCRDVVCSSPDILVLSPTSNYPTGTPADLGPFDQAPGLSPIPADAHHLFANFRNRGLGTKDNVDVRFFYSPVATLIWSEMWQFIDRSRPSSVGQGGKPATFGPVKWDLDPTPANERHLAFLAVLDAQDAPDLLPKFCHDWKAYLDFIRRADVGCRNIHWIKDPAQEVKFMVTGAPDSARTFDLEILQRLPEGADVTLYMGPDLAGKLRQRQPWAMDKWTQPASAGTNWSITLPPHPCIKFRRLRLPARACYGLELGVSFNDPNPLSPGTAADVPPASCGYSFVIRQLHRGQEVGRITYYLGS